MNKRISRAYKEYGLLGTAQKILKVQCRFVNSQISHLYSMARLYSKKQYGPWIIDSISKIGYATRSLDIFKSEQSGLFMVSADVGDDTVSIIPILKQGFGKRFVIDFSPKSAPVGISVYKDHLFVALFNFDSKLEFNSETAFYRLSLTEREGIISELAGSREKIISRSGFGGFRCSTSLITSKGLFVATADRTDGMVYIFLFDPESLELLQTRKVNVGDNAEPINIVLKASNEMLELFVSLRGAQGIIKLQEIGEVFKQDFLPVKGFSRSSVAIGNFWKDDDGIAVALWGGSPTNLTEVIQGVVQVFKRGDGRFTSSFLIPAGIHPTDVVAGDFDGDSVDEIAVLNYGSGLSPSDRIHQGNIHIYKSRGNAFVKIGEIDVPYPRIGKSFDIDGDGKDELFVTLFFEKRLLRIKYRDN